MMNEAKPLGSYRSGPGWTSKAWIAPDGKVFSIGEQHYQWAVANAQRLKKSYGVDLARVTKEDDPIRVAMLRAGFARVNYEHRGGVLIVEVLSRKWKGRVKAGYSQLIAASLDAIYSIKLQLLNDEILIAHRDHVHLFQFDDTEKLARIPMGGGEDFRFGTWVEGLTKRSKRRGE